MKKIIWLFFLPFFFLHCKQSTSTFSKTNLLTLPTFTERGINVVVEIPAGTNHKIEINKETGVFENDLENGQKRIINFLPYPGNYGFIPSTLMDEARGGDGDALDILVIAEGVPTGTILDVQLIAALLLKDHGALDTKLIAVPIDSSLRVLQTTDYQNFAINHQAAKRLVEDWFLNYKGVGKMELLGWRDEGYALKEIEKWRLTKE